MTYIPNLNTFADLIDRLIVEVNKLSYFENKKREEQAKTKGKNVAMIAHWDNLSRDACEYRSMLKNEINKMLEKVCESGEYETLNELRTFRPPDNTIANILAERCVLEPNFIEELLKNGS